MKKARQIKTKYASRPGRVQAPFLLMAGGVAFILIAILLVLTQQNAGVQDVSPVRIGQAVGNFTLTDLEGHNAKLSDYLGKVVLLNVWATWCPPCRAEMPDLQAFYSTHKDQGFVILAINAGDAKPDVQSFASSYQLSFPVLLDTQVDVIRRMGIFDYPTSVLIDRNGIVKNIQVGMYPPENLQADITPLISR
jgi:thiol-disulfide isomerase/thioredoxin